MKAFFAALIILGALAFFFTDLPKDAAGRLSGVMQGRALPYLKSKTTAVFESALSRNGAKKSTPELFHAIETNLAELSLAVNGKPIAGKDTKALVQETEALVVELKNQETPSALTTIAIALAAKILPNNFVCPVPEVSETK